MVSASEQCLSFVEQGTVVKNLYPNLAQKWDSNEGDTEFQQRLG